MSTARDVARTGDALAAAARTVERAAETIAGDGVDRDGLRVTVEGAHNITEALAELVATLLDRIPAGFIDQQTAADDLCADLRAVHGCLTSGARLLDPAVDDLRGLSPIAARTHVADPVGELAGNGPHGPGFHSVLDAEPAGVDDRLAQPSQDGPGT